MANYDQRKDPHSDSALIPISCTNMWETLRTTQRVDDRSAASIEAKHQKTIAYMRNRDYLQPAI